MYIAPGLLDRRLAFFARQENGGDGFNRPVYVKSGTFWGRIDATSSRQNIGTSPMAHMEIRTQLSATVASYVPVDPYGLIQIDGASTLYYVRGIVEMRALQGQRIDLEEVEPTAAQTFALYDPAEVTDGEHLLLGEVSFSNAFDEGFA